MAEAPTGMLHTRNFGLSGVIAAPEQENGLQVEQLLVLGLRVVAHREARPFALEHFVDENREYWLQGLGTPIWKKREWLQVCVYQLQWAYGAL